MKIVAGNMVKKYAERFNIEVEEVVNWMNTYISSPDNFPAVIAAGLMEETEEERAAHIKQYVFDEVARHED